MLMNFQVGMGEKKEKKSLKINSEIIETYIYFTGLVIRLLILS